MSCASTIPSPLDTAIANAPVFGFPPQLLEKQSQMTTGLHGTHVASIVAGNRGICRNAFLAGVLISLSDEEYDRRRSFYDSNLTTKLILRAKYFDKSGKQLNNASGKCSNYSDGPAGTMKT